MARNKEGRNPTAPLLKTKTTSQPGKKTKVDIALDSIRSVLEGMMAHQQVLTNDIRQIKATVQFQGKDWETSSYVKLLEGLIKDQAESIKALQDFIALILEGHRDGLDDFVATAEKLKEGTFQRFRDYLTVKSSAYVEKYKDLLEEGTENA